MIIDVSNTIGKHRFKPEVHWQDLLLAMDESEVDIAVVHAYAESQDNEFVEQAFTTHPKRFLGLFSVNPWEDGSTREFESALTNRGFSGLFMDPLRHGYMLCETKVFYPLLEVCATYNVPVWCYGAGEVFSAPVFFADIAQAFPTVKIIMGRMGLQYDNASAVQVAKNHPNIYLETSASMDFNTHRAIKVAGIDKVLLGTGTPEANYFPLEIAKVRNAACNYPEGEEKVLWKNAAHVFGLKEVDNDY